MPELTPRIGQTPQISVPDSDPYLISPPPDTDITDQVPDLATTAVSPLVVPYVHEAFQDPTSTLSVPAGKLTTGALAAETYIQVGEKAPNHGRILINAPLNEGATSAAIRLIRQDQNGDDQDPDVEIVGGGNPYVLINNGTLKASNVLGGYVGGAVIEGNQIQTRSNGSRVEINDDGMTFYDTDGITENIRLNTVDGSATFVGTVQSSTIETGIAGQPRLTLSPAYTGNLVPNPSFEVNLDGWTHTLGSGVDHGGLTVTRDTAVKAAGVGSMKMVGTTTGDDVFHLGHAPITAGVTYTISVMVRCTTRSAGANANRCLNVYGNVSGWVNKTTTITAVTGTAWKMHVLTFTAGPSDTQLAIRLYPVNGTIYYDEVFVAPTVYTAANNPVIPIFEYQPAATGDLPGGLYAGEWTFGDDNPDTDDYALQIRSPGFAANGVASQSYLLMQSDTRNPASGTGNISIYPQLTVPKLKRGGGGLGGTNYTTVHRDTVNWTHNSNTNWLDVPFNYIDTTVQDDDTGNPLYTSPWFRAPVTGTYLLTATVTAPAVAGVYAMRMVTGVSVIAQQYGVLGGQSAEPLTVSYAQPLNAGGTMKMQFIQATGGNVTISVNTTTTPFRATFTQVA